MFGYDVSSTNDHFVHLVLEISEALLPASPAVNTFPILRHLPSWCPGGGFNKVAERCRKMTAEMRKAPYDIVREKMVSRFADPDSITKLTFCCRPRVQVRQQHLVTCYRPMMRGADHLSKRMLSPVSRWYLTRVWTPPSRPSHIRTYVSWKIAGADTVNFAPLPVHCDGLSS